MTLTEMLLGANGEYELGVHADDVFTTERPWKVTVDLPALTSRWIGLRDRGDS